MPGVLRRFGAHVRGQLVGYIALFIALGGVSYAQVKSNSIRAKHIGVGAVASSELRDFSVGVRDLGFPIASRAVVEDEQAPLGTEFTSLAATNVRHRPQARGLMSLSGYVVATNNSASSVLVRLRFVVDGKPVPGEFSERITAGETITLPAGAVGPPCSHPALHAVGMQASATNAGSVTVTTRTLAAQVLPS